MKTFQYLLEIRKRKGAGFLLLLDPDKLANENLGEIVNHAQASGVDALLVGSSLMTRDIFDESLGEIKRHAKVPVVIFPGSLFQISGQADAILFLTVLASRNTNLIVGNHVHAAPLIRQHKLETISTAYLLVESGKLTSAHFMSDSFPIPRDKPEIAGAFCDGGRDVRYKDGLSGSGERRARKCAERYGASGLAFGRHAGGCGRRNQGP